MCGVLMRLGASRPGVFCRPQLSKQYDANALYVLQCLQRNRDVTDLLTRLSGKALMRAVFPRRRHRERSAHEGVEQEGAIARTWGVRDQRRFFHAPLALPGTVQRAFCADWSALKLIRL